MQIRTLQETDKTIYTELWRNALVTQDKFFRISIDDEPAPQIQTKFSQESFTLGAFIDDNLIGTVSVERDARAKLKHKALLFRMYVDPCVTGKGVGKALINQAISHANAIQGLRQLYLTVLDTNQRAIHLYQSAGFQTFAHEPESVRIKNQFVGELQMVCFVRTSALS